MELSYPDMDSCPDFPFHFAGNRHIFYDLVYNPARTKFLLNAEKIGAITSNGLKMLHLQAEAAWKIWQKIVS